MSATIKALGALAVVVETYVQHTFGGLFWALLILAAIDILLNMQDESKQFSKFGAAFTSIGGITILSGHVSDPAVIKVAVAVAVLAYIQIVAPQVLQLLAKLRLPRRENAFVVAALQAEVERLKSQAQKDANPPGGTGGSA